MYIFKHEVLNILKNRLALSNMFSTNLIIEIVQLVSEIINPNHFQQNYFHKNKICFVMNDLLSALLFETYNEHYKT